MSLWEAFQIQANTPSLFHFLNTFTSLIILSVDEKGKLTYQPNETDS